MSDLAPFVAAQLRDKVVTDLLEENKRLRDQLNNAYQVRITSDGGNTLATATLTSGTWRGAYRWDVPCDGDEENHWPISVFLEKLQIRIGEREYAKCEDSYEDQRSYVHMDEQPWDGDGRKEIQMVFPDDSLGIFSLLVRIDGWPKHHWFAVQQQDFSRRSSENPLDVIEVLRSEVATRYPDSTVSFVGISFLMNNTLQMMFDNLGILPLSPEDLIKEEKNNEITNIVARKLREAGNKEYGNPFYVKMHELAMVLFVIGLEEPNEEMEVVLPKLIEYQNMADEMESESTIIELVMNEYNISEDEVENRWNLYYDGTRTGNADAA